MQILFGVLCTLVGFFELLNVGVLSPHLAGDDRAYVMAVCGVLMVAGLQIIASAGGGPLIGRGIDRLSRD